MKSYLASPLIFTLALLLLGASKLATSCPIDPAVREYTQLDGKTHFFAHAWGDEFLYNFETEDGYEIVKATDGWYYYATLDSTGDYTSSHYKVGLDDPSHQFIPKHLKRSPQRMEEINKSIQDFQNSIRRGKGHRPSLVQPNEGTPVTFQAKIWGNSLLWEFETSSGYTIAKNSSTRYWCYAVLNSIKETA